MKDTDFVDGNTEDKYNAKNPISKILVNGFMRNFKGLLEVVPTPKNIIEVGAGEGFLTDILARKFEKAHIIACDLSERQNEMARENLAKFGSRMSVQKEDAENITLKDRSVNFVVCCEVLEHVEKPKKALSEIHRILDKDGYALMSVPWEPIWRMLNLVRFTYIKDLGNTPGHLNHFSRSGFVKIVEDAGFKLVKKSHPFPWSMILVKKIE